MRDVTFEISLAKIHPTSLRAHLHFETFLIHSACVSRQRCIPTMVTTCSSLPHPHARGCVSSFSSPLSGFSRTTRRVEIEVRAFLLTSECFAVKRARGGRRETTTLARQMARRANASHKNQHTCPLVAAGAGETRHLSGGCDAARRDREASVNAYAGGKLDHWPTEGPNRSAAMHYEQRKNRVSKDDPRISAVRTRSSMQRIR